MTKVRERRLKRLYYRSFYRGTHENDLLIGRFAKRYLPNMSDDELDQFEVILEQSDTDLYDWITGRNAIPADHDSEVMRQLCRYHGHPSI